MWVLRLVCSTINCANVFLFPFLGHKQHFVFWGSTKSLSTWWKIGNHRKHEKVRGLKNRKPANRRNNFYDSILKLIQIINFYFLAWKNSSTNLCRQTGVVRNCLLSLSREQRRTCISFLQWVLFLIRSGKYTSLWYIYIYILKFLLIVTNLGCCKMSYLVLRSTIAKFPALMSCCTINWFHEWPDDALNFVSNRFLGKAPTFALLSFCTTIVKINIFLTQKGQLSLLRLNILHYNWDILILGLSNI